MEIDKQHQSQKHAIGVPLYLFGKSKQSFTD